MLIVIASSLRLLVTFAIVLEVRGIFFFQIPWTTYGRSSSLNWTITTGLFLMSSPLYIVALPVLPFCMGYPEEICWTSFDMLNHASTTQKIVCSFELSLFSCLLTLVYQLIVKSMRAFVYRCLLLLWSVKPFYRRMTRRNKLQYLFHIQDWVKEVVLRRSNANPAFALFYLGVLPSFISGLL